MIAELETLIAKVAELDRKISGMVRHGPATDVDPARQRFRMETGRSADGTVAKSPWIPYGQHAGALRIHTPVSVGQNMTALSPSGDPQQAVGIPMTWSTANASPSQSGDENVITFGNVRIELKGDRLLISAGGVSVEISGNGLKVTGGKVEHDGKNIGRDHRHTGVEPGGGQTGDPA